MRIIAFSVLQLVMNCLLVLSCHLACQGRNLQIYAFGLWPVAMTLNFCLIHRPFLLAYPCPVIRPRCPPRTSSLPPLFVSSLLLQAYQLSPTLLMLRRVIPGLILLQPQFSLPSVCSLLAYQSILPFHLAYQSILLANLLAYLSMRCLLVLILPLQAPLASLTLQAPQPFQAQEAPPANLAIQVFLDRLASRAPLVSLLDLH